MSQLQVDYDYAAVVARSEKVAWKVDDVMGPKCALDFSRRFLPEALALTNGVSCLDDAEKLTLNHIAGNSYLNLFAFVEEYIIATACRHAEAEMFGDHDALRALLRFADEELKHQQLFKRYRDAFERDFGHPCQVLDQPAAVAAAILSKGAVAVMLVTLHLEIMTQAHYVECVKDDRGVDPLFASLLKHHWMEEAQHAKIDMLELGKLVGGAPPESLTAAFDEYIEIVDAFDDLLRQQANMNVTSLAGARDRRFGDDDRAAIADSQYRALQQTFLVYGMMHPDFLDVVGRLSADGRRLIEERAAALG